MLIDKRELAMKIGKLKQVVPKKCTVTALQGVLLKDGCLTASNTELTVRAKLEGTEGETFIIPAKAFDLISNLPDGMVEIIHEQKGDSHSITIKAESIRNRYQTMAPENFPLPNVEGGEETGFHIESEKLLTSMRHVSYAIPAKADHVAMTGLCLKAKEGMLDFVGADGRVLAWDRLGFEGEFEIIIPKPTVERILSLGIEGNVTISHNKNGAAFITEEYEVYTRVIAGRYLDFGRMFKDMALSTVVKREDFLEALIRAKTCTDEKSVARLDFSGWEVGISIKDSTTDYQETVRLQEEIPGELVIGFDARLVIETLKTLDCDNVALYLDSDKYPMLLEAEDSDFKALVFPVLI